MRWLWTVALGLTLWSSTYAQALADKRVALVIGNGAYAHAPHLPNPPHDAQDVAGPRICASWCSTRAATIRWRSNSSALSGQRVQYRFNAVSLRSTVRKG
jgi:hypothetical protein